VDCATPSNNWQLLKFGDGILKPQDEEEVKDANEKNNESWSRCADVFFSSRKCKGVDRVDYVTSLQQGGQSIGTSAKALYASLF
jgi:hypothetical protein